MRRVILLVAMGLVTAAMFAASTIPAFAQPTTITATGVLGAPFFEGQDPEPLYPLTDEATGTTYTLIGSFVDVTPFVGQRVTIQGERVPGIDPFAFFVRQIQSAPAVGRGTLPNTGGPSLLVPIIASILGGGIIMGGCSAATQPVRTRNLLTYLEGRGIPWPSTTPSRPLSFRESLSSRQLAE